MFLNSFLTFQTFLPATAKFKKMTFFCPGADRPRPTYLKYMKKLFFSSHYNFRNCKHGDVFQKKIMFKKRKLLGEKWGKGLASPKPPPVAIFAKID